MGQGSEEDFHRAWGLGVGQQRDWDEKGEWSTRSSLSLGNHGIRMLLLLRNENMKPNEIFTESRISGCREREASAAALLPSGFLSILSVDLGLFFRLTRFVTLFSRAPHPFHSALLLNHSPETEATLKVRSSPIFRVM